MPKDLSTIEGSIFNKYALKNFVPQNPTLCCTPTELQATKAYTPYILMGLSI